MDIKIKKLFCIVISIISISSCISQNNLVDGYIVKVNNDTVFGKFKVKDYSTSRYVKLDDGKKSRYYSVGSIKNLTVSGDLYVSSSFELWPKYLFKKSVAGAVNLYRLGNYVYLGANDRDINIDNLNDALKLYCNDYPNFEDSIKNINNSNVIGFIENYNQWKMNHTTSKSNFENNIHKKDLLDFKASYFYPGLGLEIGLAENFTINSMLNLGLALNNAGFNMNPYVDTQLRFYHNIDQRKKDNLRTYKYSGNYISLTHILGLNQKTSIVGFEYGWQRTFGKHSYLNLSVGLGKEIEKRYIYLIYDLGYGFKF